jgi:RNA recognition motif-containing protein
VDSSASAERPVITEIRGIHLRNLPRDVTGSQIRNLLARSLGVKNVDIQQVELLKPKHESGRSSATVEFQNRDTACRAVKVLNGHRYLGRKLEVKCDKDPKTLAPVEGPAYVNGVLPRNTSPEHVVSAIPTMAPASISHTELSMPSAFHHNQWTMQPITAADQGGNSFETCERYDARRISDPGPMSPQVVDGSMSRLTGSHAREASQKSPKPASESSKCSCNSDRDRSVRKTEVRSEGSRSGHASKGKGRHQ